MGFGRGTAPASLFYHKGSGVTIMVHGNDFFGFGTSDRLHQFQDDMTKTFECKIERAGWGWGREEELRILGRVLTLDDRGATVEADPALLEECIAAMDLVGANGFRSVHVRRNRAEKGGMGRKGDRRRI